MAENNLRKRAHEEEDSGPSMQPRKSVMSVSYKDIKGRLPDNYNPSVVVERMAEVKAQSLLALHHHYEDRKRKKKLSAALERKKSALKEARVRKTASSALAHGESRFKRFRKSVPQSKTPSKSSVGKKRNTGMQPENFFLLNQSAAKENASTGEHKTAKDGKVRTSQVDERISRLTNTAEVVEQFNDRSNFMKAIKSKNVNQIAECLVNSKLPQEFMGEMLSKCEHKYTMWANIHERLTMGDDSHLPPTLADFVNRAKNKQPDQNWDELVGYLKNFPPFLLNIFFGRMVKDKSTCSPHRTKDVLIRLALIGHLLFGGKAMHQVLEEQRSSENCYVTPVPTLTHTEDDNHDNCYVTRVPTHSHTETTDNHDDNDRGNGEGGMPIEVDEDTAVKNDETNQEDSKNQSQQVNPVAEFKSPTTVVVDSSKSSTILSALQHKAKQEEEDAALQAKIDRLSRMDSKESKIAIGVLLDLNRFHWSNSSGRDKENGSEELAHNQLLQTVDEELMNFLSRQCHFCDKKFEDLSSRTEHEEKMHASEKKATEEKENEMSSNDFDCKYCTQLFSTEVQQHDHNIDEHRVSHILYILNKYDLKEGDWIQLGYTNLLQRCSYCPVVTKSEIALNKHTEKEHKLKECYMCNTCGLLFPKPLLVNQHQYTCVQEYDDLITVECKKCQESFRSLRLLDVHSKFINCQNDPSFNVPSLLEYPKPITGHKENDGKRGRIYCCCCCGMKFDVEFDRNVHEKEVHDFIRSTGRNRMYCELLGTEDWISLGYEYLLLPCKHCEFKAKSSVDREEHECLQHNKKPDECEKVKCNICSVECPSWRRLARHQNQAHDEQRKEQQSNLCEMCGTVLNSKRAIAAHMIQCHNVEVQDSGLKKRAKGPCHKCGKKLNIDHLPIHNLLVNCTNDPDFVPNQEAIEKYWKYKCDRCDQRFQTLRKKKLHMTYRDCVEGNTGDITCEKCGQRFSMRKELKAHHDFVNCNHDPNFEVLKKVKCHQCGSELKNRDSLRQHLMFTCPNPNSSNVKQEDMRRTATECKKCGKVIGVQRMRVHNLLVNCTNDPNFSVPEEIRDKYMKHKCYRCNQRYESLNRMEYHVKYRDCVAGEPREDIQCEKCDEFFPNRKQLREHHESVNCNNDPEFKALEKVKCHKCDLELKHGDSLSKHLKRNCLDPPRIGRKRLPRQPRIKKEVKRRRNVTETPPEERLEMVAVEKREQEIPTGFIALSNSGFFHSQPSSSLVASEDYLYLQEEMVVDSAYGGETLFIDQDGNQYTKQAVADGEDVYIPKVLEEEQVQSYNRPPRFNEIIVEQPSEEDYQKAESLTTLTDAASNPTAQVIPATASSFETFQPETMPTNDQLRDLNNLDSGVSTWIMDENEVLQSQQQQQSEEDETKFFTQLYQITLPNGISRTLRLLSRSPEQLSETEINNVFSYVLKIPDVENQSGDLLLHYDV